MELSSNLYKVCVTRLEEDEEGRGDVVGLQVQSYTAKPLLQALTLQDELLERFMRRGFMVQPDGRSDGYIVVREGVFLRVAVEIDRLHELN